MKKIMSTIAAFTIVATSTSTIISCSENMTYYNQFMDGINKKKTFVMLISAQNCPHCKVTEQTTIASLYNNGKGTEVFLNYLEGSNGLEYSYKNYVTDQTQIEGIKNSYLLDTSNVKDYNKVWGEKWAKKLLDYIVQQERNAHLINGEVDYTITADSLGIKSTPAWIYVRDGKYVGFENGQIGDLTTGADNDKYMSLFAQHIIREDWEHPLPVTI